MVPNPLESDFWSIDSCISNLFIRSWSMLIGGYMSLFERIKEKRIRNISKELDKLQKAVRILQYIISKETDKDWKEYFTAELEVNEAEIKYLQKKQEMIWRRI